MNSTESLWIVDEEGVRALLERDPTAPGSAGTVIVRLDDGQRLALPSHLLEARTDGSYRARLRFREVVAQAGATAAGDVHVIPLIEETLAVGKRVVETGGVRVTKTVTEREEVVDEALFQERVEVQRVPIGRMIEAPAAPRQEGDTLIIPLVEEVLVVEKRLMLVEEIHVTKTRAEVRQPQTVTLRREEVQVEELSNTAPLRDGTELV